MTTEGHLFQMGFLTFPLWAPVGLPGLFALLPGIVFSPDENFVVLVLGLLGLLIDRECLVVVCGGFLVEPLLLDLVLPARLTRVFDVSSAGEGELGGD